MAIRVANQLFPVTGNLETWTKYRTNGYSSRTHHMQYIFSAWSLEKGTTILSFHCSYSWMLICCPDLAEFLSGLSIQEFIGNGSKKSKASFIRTFHHASRPVELVV